MSLRQLNASDEAEATALLLRCCGSRRWARAMVARRPFDSLDDLQATANAVADTMTRDDWLEAFSQHPRIGDRDVSDNWEAHEQSGVQGAAADVLERLARSNRDYEQRFGFVFLVCATGKSADEMLALLERRLNNEPAREWRVTADEQRKITTLRLAKLVGADLGAPAT